MLWCMVNGSHINLLGYLNIIESRSQRSLRHDPSVEFTVVLIAPASLYTDNSVSRFSTVSITKLRINERSLTDTAGIANTPHSLQGQVNILYARVTNLDD